MSKVLLTGAGLVGSQMIKILNEQQIQPVVIDLKFNWDFLNTIIKPDGFIPIEGSVLDRELLARVFKNHDIKAISHSAAVLPMRVGHDPHPGFFEVNVNGTANLIFTAMRHGVERFVLFSTNGVYRFRDCGVSGPVDETYPVGLSLHNSYGNSKAAAEFLLKELTLAGRIDGKIIRPGEIYGPVADSPGGEPIYWKQMFDSAISGEVFQLQDHPEHRLDWVYCKDVARVACSLLLADKTRNIEYNASFGRCIGIYDIKRELDHIFPGNRVELINCKEGGWNYPLKIQRIAEDIGVEPEYDLREGIKDYAEWQRQWSGVKDSGKTGKCFGSPIASYSGISVIECKNCGFKHQSPLPDEEEVASLYSGEYYEEVKPEYLENVRRDTEYIRLWAQAKKNLIEEIRPDLKEKADRRILDIGSSFGQFLELYIENGWQAAGVEPSAFAANEARKIKGLRVHNDMLEQLSDEDLGGPFDVVHMREVINHVLRPIPFVQRIHDRLLTPGGLFIVETSNDFNVLQEAVVKLNDDVPWWIVPDHVSYFDFSSLRVLLERTGFSVCHSMSTFPMEIFPLMGENYRVDATVGQACHRWRMNFELNTERAGISEARNRFYSSLASAGFGRAAILFGQKAG